MIMRRKITLCDRKSFLSCSKNSLHILTKFTLANKLFISISKRCLKERENVINRIIMNVFAKYHFKEKKSQKYILKTSQCIEKYKINKKVSLV